MAETSETFRRSGPRKLSVWALILRLWRYVSRNQVLIIIAVLLSLSSSLLTLYGPKLSGCAVNVIAEGAGKVNFPLVYRYAGEMLLCYVGAAVLTYLLNLVMVRLSREVSRQMRDDVFCRLTELPLSFVDKSQAGDLISVITYDISTVNQSLSTDLLQIFQSSVMVVGSFTMMATISPVMVLIFAVTVPAAAAAITWLGKRARPMFRDRSSRLGSLNGFVSEMLAGQKTIRAYGREDRVLESFDEKNTSAADAYIRAEFMGTITGPTVGLINNVSLTIVCVAGSMLFLHGRLRLGDLSSFVQYSRRFSGPINEIANMIADLQSALAAAERVFELLEEPPEKQDAPGALELRNVTGEVRMEHVNFSYVPDKPLIRDLCFRAAPGSLTAIVGPTGAGKTTIVNLLMRFYDVQGGGIFIDGHEIRDLTRSSLRGAFAMVLQDTWLYHGTILENIIYGKPEATFEDVVRAARAAQIDGYIRRLPMGYDTMLTDNGSSVSKGQKQMITIARAMLQQAPMLILDEATSNVDTYTEQLIQKGMDALIHRKTCFVIAHRLSTIRSADHILVLKDGMVVEQGNHASLMAQNGVYRNLYNAQFENLT